MTQKLEMYKCDTCKTIVQVLLNGEEELVCCNEPMKLIQAHSNEEMKNEFHLPVVLTENGEEFIQIGKEKHPMTEEHHIEFIQIISECGKKILLHYLTPDLESKIKMYCEDFGNYSIKELCNIHGLWENKK